MIGSYAHPGVLVVVGPETDGQPELVGRSVVLLKQQLDRSLLHTKQTDIFF
jgi:hypothetical protein